MHTRSYRHFSAEEREILSLGLAHGHSIRTMAAILGRAPSTVNREVVRNTPRGRPYRACTAQHFATSRAPHPRRAWKLRDPWLWRICHNTIDAGLLPRADCRATQTRVSSRQAETLFNRNHLRGVVRVSTRGSAERIAGRFAAGPQGTSPAGARPRPSWLDSQYDTDHRTPDWGHQSHGARPLGRRLA